HYRVSFPWFGLGHAEPVAGIVLHQCLDAVEVIGGLGKKLDAPGLELCEGLAAVVHMEDTHAEGAGLYELLEGRHMLGCKHWAFLHCHQDAFHLRLGFRPYREPAEAVVHSCVGAHLESELVAVEFQGGVLVQNIDRDMTDACDHGDLSEGEGNSSAPTLTN